MSNSMKEILDDLRGTVAVKGCLVMMHDGIVVAQALEDGQESEAVSGLTSFLTSTLNRVLTEGKMGSFSGLNMQSTHGKVLVIDMGEAFLVVLTNQFGKLDMDMPEIQDAAKQLRRLSRVSS